MNAQWSHLPCGLVITQNSFGRLSLQLADLVTIISATQNMPMWCLSAQIMDSLTNVDTPGLWLE